MTARRLALLLAAAGVAAASFFAPSAAAQTVTWELLPNPVQQLNGSYALAWQPEATGRTLYSTDGSDVFRRDPGATTWTDVSPRIGGGRSAAVTTGGCLLIGNISGPTRVGRTCDRGATWTKPLVDQEQVHCLYTRPSDGATLGCLAYPASGAGLILSHDDGATWATLPYVVTPGTAARSLREVPGPDGRPRLVAGAANGIAVSDDGGQTWTKTNVWGEFRWLVIDIEFDAVTGTVYAGARDFANTTGTSATVLGSDDRGATWTVRGRFPTGFINIAVGADGALYAGTNEGNTGVGHLWRTADGGQTFEPAGTGYDDTSVITMESGPDGRVYVGGTTGVWRTVAPLAVAGEGAPEPAALAVRVWPNPTARGATVSVSLAVPERVTVTVYDVQGREVLTAHDGAATDGQRFTVETAGLAPGAYVVRATSASGTATAGLTVVR